MKKKTFEQLVDKAHKAIDAAIEAADDYHRLNDFALFLSAQNLIAKDKSKRLFHAFKATCGYCKHTFTYMSTDVTVERNPHVLCGACAYNRIGF